MNTGAADAERRANLARLYDLDLADDPGDLDLYLALADRVTGPVLELAVGSGRIAVALASDGRDVVGVDNDPTMLARAAEAWAGARAATDAPARGGGVAAGGSLRLVEADLLELALEERFGLVVLALNSLLLLGDRAAQVRALRVMAEHLRPDGLAVIDVWLPAPDDLAIYDGRLQVEWLRSDPETGEQVAKLASARFDAATATVTLTTLFDASPVEGGPVRRVTRTDRLRLVSAGELEAMAREAGLATEVLAGDHGLTAFGPGADRAVLVARPL